MPPGKTGLVLLLTSCLTIPGCVAQESEPSSVTKAVPSAEVTVASPAPRDIAVAIEASKPSLRSEARTGKAGEGAVIETRYFVGNTLVLVEETAASTATGGSETSYYIDDDRLAFFRSRGTRPNSSGDELITEHYEIELGFDPDGNLVDAVKFVNGERAMLERFDLEAPKARARMLLLEDRQ